jgi:trans-2-enoyl-CoA reductase
MATTKKPKKVHTRGFKRGYGYNSRISGNFYTFLGVDTDGNFHFFRRFSQDWQRMSKREALNLFTPVQGEVDDRFGSDNEDKLDLDSFTLGGMI